MVVNETLNASTSNISQVVNYIGDVGLWIQAAGLFIIIWLIFQMTLLIINWKKRKTLSQIMHDVQLLKKDMKKVEQKMDVLINEKNEK